MSALTKIAIVLLVIASLLLSAGVVVFVNKVEDFRAEAKTATDKFAAEQATFAAEHHVPVLMPTPTTPLVPLHRGFDCLGVSGIERGQVGAVYLDGDAPSCAGAA